MNFISLVYDVKEQSYGAALFVSKNKMIERW